MSHFSTYLILKLKVFLQLNVNWIFEAKDKFEEVDNLPPYQFSAGMLGSKTSLLSEQWNG